MIAFVTLFLGLTFGSQPVEVAVSGPVARVELRLDGATVATLRKEPWTADCDFGAELAPHRFEAVAFDAVGREVGRAVQWLNLPQPKAALSVVLGARRPGRPRVADLSWESAAGAVPEKVTATLDGAPLEVADPHRLVLPVVDESRLHLLSVEMEFDDHVVSRADVTFGGEYAEEVSTEITALPLRARAKSTPRLTVETARGWFLEHGDPIDVIAVEKEEAEIVVVMGRPFPRFHAYGERYKPLKSLRLDKDLRFRFLSPRPEQSQGVTMSFRLFPLSPALDSGGLDLYGLLTSLVRSPQDSAPRIPAATAVAGLAAFEGRHRRAVVLLASGAGGGSGPAGGEEVAPEQVRRYLDRLRVPFFVWDPEERPDPSGAWSGARSVGSFRQLAEAFADIKDDLDRQWIVWLDGRHLPQDVELAPGVEDFELAR